MKNFFAIHFNLDSGANQAEIMQFLKGQGAEVIQTSDGLCVKTEKTQSDLQKSWSEKGWTLNIESLNPSAVQNDAQASPDLKAFLNS